MLATLALCVAGNPDLAHVARELADALRVSAQDLHALAAKLAEGRDVQPQSSALLPKQLIPSMVSGDKAQNRARLVYMRMTNLLWDSEVLPLPFYILKFPVPKLKTQYIQRAAVLRILDKVRPIVHEQLRLRPPEQPSLGCLEWGLVYQTTYFNETCAGVAHKFVYSKTAKIPLKRRGWYSELRMDLCRTPIDRSVRARVDRHGGFKLVLATEVFEHLITPARCMANLHALVAKGGVVVLTTPFQYPHHGVPDDYYRYTYDGLAAIAKQAGFAVISSFGMGNRRELHAMNAGFPVDAVPPAVFHAPADAFYHKAAVVLRKN